MKLHLSPTSGIPLYQQMIEQVKLAIQTGAVSVGEQLPSVRRMSEELLLNPNTVARAYRDLEQQGVIELRHGSGAFVLESIIVRSELMTKAKKIVGTAIEKLSSFDLSEADIRRLVEDELARRQSADQSEANVA